MTGTFIIVIITAAVLTWPIALVLLSLYRATVIRTMNTQRPEMATPADDSPPRIEPPAAQLRIVTRQLGPIDSGSTLFNTAMAAPRTLARSYLIAVAVFAVTMGLFAVIAEGQFGLLEISLLTTYYLWPGVMAAHLIATSDARHAAALYGAYFAALLVIYTLTGIISNGDGVNAVAFFIGWVAINIVPTALAFMALNSRIRAVGPIILAFLVISVGGGAIALSVFGGNVGLLEGFVEIADALGLNVLTTFLSMLLLGVVIFAALGWLSVSWISREFVARRLNDQSLMIDAMVALFSSVYAVLMSTRGAIWLLSAPAGFAIYKIVLGRLLAGTRHRRGSAPPRNLLFLRVFSDPGLRERLFSVLTRHWRYIGTVRMLMGPDLAKHAVRPNQFVDFVTGRTVGSFVRETSSIEQRVQSLESGRDFDGRFRVHDFFCYPDTWKSVLRRLVRDNNVIVLDARRLSAKNRGVEYELRELLNEVPLRRAVIVVGPRTGMRALQQILEDGWAELSVSSPNRSLDAPEIVLHRTTTSNNAEMVSVLNHLCAAAESSAAGAPL